jgi:2,4-dichlorophenol 6-monooxygenase
MSWFTLVTGIAGQVWEESVAALALPYLRCVRVGAGKYSDPYFYWARIREIEEGGALLVRPDGVIAWRQKQAVSGKRDVSTLLSSVLAQCPRDDLSSVRSALLAIGCEMLEGCVSFDQGGQLPG